MKETLKLTLAMVTSREHPEFNWFIDSVRKEFPDDPVKILLVSSNVNEKEPIKKPEGMQVEAFHAKPNVWSGPYRKTPVDWWTKSNSINTALCHCKDEWICFVDDRAILKPGFADGVRKAIAGRYVMAGGYEKRTGLEAENGIISNEGIVIAKDHRDRNGPCPPQWLYGCVVLAKLDWWLEINGSPEKTCGLGFEDSLTGFLFENNKRKIHFDSSSSVILDRSPDKIGPAIRRESKEKHSNDANDKAHTLLKWARTALRSDNDFDIRELRRLVHSGGQFPKPDDGEHFDWFDKQPLKDMI